MVLFFRLVLVIFSLLISSYAYGINKDVQKQQSPSKIIKVDEFAAIISFLNQLKAAVKKNDSKWISEQVHYPWHVYIVKPKEKNILLRGPGDFIKNYSEIFSLKLKKTLLNENAKKLKLDEKTGSTVILGSGYMTLWYIYKEQKVKILGFYPN